jgi:hypothetical protein
MKTQVLTVKPISNSDSLDVVLLIGEEKHSFTFSRQFDQIGEKELQIITYESVFGEMFQFNQQIVSEVMSLVKRVYGGEKVKFPKDVVDFGTPREALDTLKPFKGEQVVSNV